MSGLTTAMPTSFKKELLQGIHNFNASVAPTGNTANGSSHVVSLSALTGIGPGSLITGTGIPANTYVGFIDSSTSFYMTQQATATNTGTTLTCVGHDFKVALAKTSVTGTYGAATVNYSDLTGNSDEVANGSGYTTGGYDITSANNTTPTTSGTTGYTTPAVNPSWTSATFSTTGCIMYNAGALNKAVYVGDFGGTQTVSAGTLTLLMPTNNSSTALLRLA